MLNGARVIAASGLLAGLASLAGCRTEVQLSPPTPCVQQPVRAAIRLAGAHPQDWSALDLDRDVFYRLAPYPALGWHYERFPEPMLVDIAGEPAAYAGDITMSGCLDEAAGWLYVGPGDLPDPDRPTN